jgi:hypothetical protein
MLLPLLALASHEANADDWNYEPLFGAGVSYVPGAEHRWGAEAWFHPTWAIGDSCGYNEVDCRGGTWWPLAGARVAATWRGGDRLGAAAEPTIGVAAVDMYHHGFFPQFGVFAAAGPALEVGEGLAFSVGGELSRTLSITVSQPSHGGTSYRTYGPDMLSLVAGGRGRLGSEGWRPHTTFGFELATVAATLF